MKPLRICHIATLSALGGVERILIDLLNYSLKRDTQHFLVATSYQPELIKLIENVGYEWFEPTGRFRYDPRKLVGIARYLNHNHIDVVHSRNAYANSWANLSTLFMRTPPAMITGEHGLAWSSRPPISWLDGLAHHRSRLVVANSKASAQMLQYRYKIPSKKIRVIYNGIQVTERIKATEARHTLNLPTEMDIVGSVGRLDSIKDLHTLIDAAEIVLKYRRNTMFVLIGGGPQETFLRTLIEQKGIEDVFIMTGRQTNARTLMAGLDLYVSTSIRESFGNTLVEAALMEKPVIAPQIDGIPEAVENGETGVLLSPTLPIRHFVAKGTSRYPHYVIREGHLQPPQSLNPQLLADTIIQLLDDPNRRREMGKKGRQRAEQLFSLERYVDDLEKIYREASE